MSSAINQTKRHQNELPAFKPLYKAVHKSNATKIENEEQKTKTPLAPQRTKKMPKSQRENYRNTLQQYVANAEGKGTDFKRNRAGMQQYWLKIVYLVKHNTALGHVVAIQKRVLINAVGRIKREWRWYNLRKIIRFIAFVKISNIGWRLTLWARIARKTKAADKITNALQECARIRSTAKLVVIFRQLRYKVMNAQRMTRSYLVCKHARLLLLSKKWDKIEKEEKELLRKTTGSKFMEKIQNASSDLVGDGGALSGMSSMVKRLNEFG
jgi:hypothetical protein